MGRYNSGRRSCCRGGSLGGVGGEVRCDIGRRCWCRGVGFVIVVVGIVGGTVVRGEIGVVAEVDVVGVVVIVVFVVVVVVAAAVA